MVLELKVPHEATLATLAPLWPVLLSYEPDLKVRVSGRIREHYFYGKAYYRLQGQTLAALPSEGRDHPDPGFLRWHNENRFVE